MNCLEKNITIKIEHMFEILLILDLKYDIIIISIRGSG